MSALSSRIRKGDAEEKAFSNVREAIELYLDTVGKEFVEREEVLVRELEV